MFETEQTDPLTDTDKRVGLIVRRIKEELEAHRDQQEDMLRRVIREERGWLVKFIRDMATYAIGIIKHL